MTNGHPITKKGFTGFDMKMLRSTGHSIEKIGFVSLLAEMRTRGNGDKERVHPYFCFFYLVFLSPCLLVGYPQLARVP
jgi:hypothetical protein